MTHVEIQTEMLRPGRSEQRTAICRHIGEFSTIGIAITTRVLTDFYAVRFLPARNFKTACRSLMRLCDPAGGYKGEWPQALEDEIWA
jgi:hypothetical protein